MSHGECQTNTHKLAEELRREREQIKQQEAILDKLRLELEDQDKVIILCFMFYALCPCALWVSSLIGSSRRNQVSYHAIGISEKGLTEYSKDSSS